jgi:hypothetical protein
MLRARKLASAALTTCLVTAGGIGTAVLTAGAAHAGTCPTASQIVTDLNAIASGAGGLGSKLAALTRDSSPDDVQSAAQSAAAGLSAMSSDFAADTSALGGCTELGSAISQTAADAFASLADATKQMLSPLTGAHPIFAQYGLTAPITSSLRALEAALDAYTHALLTAAPSQQGTITSGQSSTDSSLTNAISSYDQTCIPSPLYPTVPPICVPIPGI